MVYRWECLNKDAQGKKNCFAGSHHWSPHRDLVGRKALDHERKTEHKTAVYGRVLLKGHHEAHI